MAVVRFDRKVGPAVSLEPAAEIRAFVERNIAKGRTRYGRLTPPEEWPQRPTPTWIELFVDGVRLESMPDDAEAQFSTAWDALGKTTKGAFTIRNIEHRHMRIELLRDGDQLLLSATDDVGVPVSGFEVVPLEWHQVLAAWAALSPPRPDRT